MAEGTGSEQLEKRVDTPEPDPIADRSFSIPLLLFSLLMIGTLVWSLYDEVVGQRPWKDLQSDFVSRYSRRLKRVKPQQKNAEAEIKQSLLSWTPKRRSKLAPPRYRSKSLR